MLSSGIIITNDNANFLLTINACLIACNNIEIVKAVA